MVGLRFFVFVINCHMVSSVGRVPVCSTGCQAWIQGRWNGWIFTPLYLSPLLSFLFSYPLNIEIIFDFPDVITKIHPPFQNPGSALEYNRKLFSDCPVAVLATSVRQRNVTDVTWQKRHHTGSKTLTYRPSRLLHFREWANANMCNPVKHNTQRVIVTW